MNTFRHLLIATALLSSSFALAQTVPPTYEFLTVVEIESQYSRTAKLLFAPAFQGQTELPLTEMPTTRKEATAVYQHNLELVNQQLAAVTAAGWEFVQTSSTTTNTFVGGSQLYLFRRRKP